MKNLSLQIMLLFALFQLCDGQTIDKVIHKPNAIDRIQNTKQIADLLTKIDSGFKNWTVNEKLEFAEKKCQRIADSLKVQPWTKADFDNNGLTDILVIGTWDRHSVLCILDKGEKYEIKYLTRRSFQECSFPIVQNKKIQYYFESQQEKDHYYDPRKLEQITLVYKFGDFIEENAKPAKHKIKEIEYSTTECFGLCPVYKLTIHADRSANWFADMYNKILK
ncbi:MAG: DUF6438 domain-containing protein [Sphingobacteriaceae bacterium]